MLEKGPSQPVESRHLRLWPGLALAGLVVLVRFLLPLVYPEGLMIAVLGGLLGGLLIVGWWLFFSRAPWAERWTMLAILAAALFVTARFLVHPSIGGGMMGLMPYIFALPLAAVGLVAGLAAAARFGWPRRPAAAAAILLGCLGLTLVRTGGMDAAGKSDFAWRWSKSPEERLLEMAEEKMAASRSAAAAAAAAGEWPGFRGTLRDGAAPGTAIAKDWSATPPALVWKRPVGPAWSSFAVRGNLVYTQEQRGEEEIVAAYDLLTGEPVWKHRDPVRFWESNAGAGPRGTPTLSGERVYAFGGTGVLNALDAETGAKVWSLDAAAGAEEEVPTWGFSSSPLVYGDLLIVAVSGRLVAYDREKGAQRWAGPADRGASYCSPQLLAIGGVDQIVMTSEKGALGADPQSGKVLWEHAWAGYPIVQPALTAEGDVLVSVDAGSGVRRLHVEQRDGRWDVKEGWTSTGLKPYFNDFVVHRGHAFGFDGSILAAIDLTDGQRKWKGGRYGRGQLILLPAQDLLLVLSEQGELAPVEAQTEKFVELARVPAIEGKTWNHPVLVGDLVLVRNDQEMAAYRLPAAETTRQASR
jgi:outer membrane protein assembly factor BamB